MERTFIDDGKTAGVPITPAMKVGNVILISGQVPVDLNTKELVKGDIEEQTKAVLERIKYYVERSGGTMSDIVKTTVFLSDVKYFSGMNRVYAEYFPENPPTRSCVEAKLAIKADVEIEAIAILK